MKTRVLLTAFFACMAFLMVSCDKINDLAPAQFKEVQVDGSLYIKLNSGETISLSMVKIAVYECSYISNKMIGVNNYFSGEKV